MSWILIQVIGNDPHLEVAVLRRYKDSSVNAKRLRMILESIFMRKLLISSKIFDLVYINKK